MNRLLSLIFLFLAFTIVSGQQLSVDFSAGYSSFAMEDLKKFNNYMLDYLPFEAKITESFPDNVEYKIGAAYQLEKYFSIGARWSITSTGSRIHVKDYSGEYSFKALTSMNTLGAVATIGPFQWKNFSLYQNNTIGKTFSKLVFEENFSLFEQSGDTSFSFKSGSTFFEPNLQLFYNLGPIELGLACGYFIDFKGIYEAVSDDTWYLELYGKNIKSDWSGMRYSFILRVKPFYYQKKAPEQ